MLPADFWGLAGPEPDLEDVLQDPLVRTLMAGDHVEPEDLKRRCRDCGRVLAKKGKAA